MHKNSPGIRRVACRDDAYSDSSSLRPRAHTHARTHTEIQSLGWEYTRSLGVNRFGIAGTQRSRKKTYSIPITRLIRPNPRASILRRGRQSRFPFYRVYDGRWIHPFCARTVATTLPVFATRSSISSLHTRNPGIPAKSALFLAIRLAIRKAISPRVFASSSSSYSSSATSSRLPLPPPPPLCTFKAFWKPTTDGNPTVHHFYPSAGRAERAQGSNPPTTPSISHGLPLPPIPADLSYTRAPPRPLLNGVERFTRFERLPLAWPRSIFLHPPRLPIFHRFLALLLPSAGFIRLNSHGWSFASVAWLDGSARHTHEWVDAELLDQSRPVASIQSP